MGINEIIQIGNRIRKLRTEKGFTQKRMAEMAGIPYSTYSNYENNNREPSLMQLQKIASSLEISLFDLITQNDYESLLQKEVHQKIENEINEGKIHIITEDEQELTRNYLKLNVIGKKEARKRVEELTEIPRYIQKETPIRNVPPVQAAHNDHADEPGELEKMRKDLETLKRPDLLPNAAHERTDIEYTEEDRQADEDMLD